MQKVMTSSSGELALISPIKVHILSSCSANRKQVLCFFRLGNTNREDDEISPHFSHDRKTKGYDFIGVSIFLSKLMRLLRKKRIIWSLPYYLLESLFKATKKPPNDDQHANNMHVHIISGGSLFTNNISFEFLLSLLYHMLPYFTLDYENIMVFFSN